MMTFSFYEYLIYARRSLLSAAGYCKMPMLHLRTFAPSRFLAASPSKHSQSAPAWPASSSMSRASGPACQERAFISAISARYLLPFRPGRQDDDDCSVGAPVMLTLAGRRHQINMKNSHVLRYSPQRLTACSLVMIIAL